MSEKMILLVENNLNDELLTVQTFTMAKLINQVMIVRDGQEALDYLFYKGNFVNRPIGNPQIILLDLELPRVGGLEVLRKIREKESTKLIPVIILTSSQLEKDYSSNYSSGANSYLLKPVDIEQFNQVIKDILQYWLELNQKME